MSSDDKVEVIRRSAIRVFAQQGFRRTSMADLAAAAGMSRPALYQYFRNRADVFRAALGAVLDDAADGAVAALAADGDVRSQLDAYLQRAFGDPHSALASAPRGDEIVDAKLELAADVAEAAASRRRAGLTAYLAERVDATDRARLVVDLLELAPQGLKADGPPSAVFRRRLSALAESAAALVAAPAPVPTSRPPSR